MNFKVSSPQTGTPSAAIRPFGFTAAGQSVDLVSLAAGPFEAEIITFGAALRAFRGPDRHGERASIVLGYGCVSDYEASFERQGAIMGRFANRIGGARFRLDGTTYGLIANNGPHCIHGGEVGFDRRVWTRGAMEAGLDDAHASFQLSSPDGDEGFPGRLDIQVTYRLSKDGALAVAYHATTTRPTVLNLTNHAYFNLQGEGTGSILDHMLQINADTYLEIDETVLPTGHIASVAGTPFDFRSPKRMGDGVRADHPQVRFGRGYDHCFALWPTARDRLHEAARVWDPISGRTLRVQTSEPGLQLNSGNVLSGRFCGDSGRTYRQSDGFCLEAQHYPDAPNQPHFPSTVLKPRDVFRSQTVYHLGASDQM